MKRAAETYGPAYDAADITFVLTVTCVVLLALLGLYAVGRWVASGGSIVDELLEDDVCEDCADVLTEDNRAITCASHLLCEDCDCDHNPCRECRFAKVDESIWCISFDDPFFDRLGAERALRQDPPAVRRFLEDGAR